MRHERIFSNPLTAARATTVCQSYRNNRSWMQIESTPVMSDVWAHAEKHQFAFRRIIDIRLALTLLHHGVTEFATANTLRISETSDLKRYGIHWDDLHKSPLDPQAILPDRLHLTNRE